MTKTLEAPETKEVVKNDSIGTELEYPETVFVRDIETRVFQSLVLQCLAKIKGITLIERNFIDNILGRETVEGIKGIHTEQDSKNNAVNVKVEVNVCYGISIPEKAEEIQTKLTEEIIQLTGLHVASVHVVFKNVILADPDEQLIHLGKQEEGPALLAAHVANDDL